jgi:hypothetical protein
MKHPEPQAAPARRRLVWTLVLLAPLLAAGWIAAARATADSVIARAASHLERGEAEAASDALGSLPVRVLLSRDARRRAAALFFRLGEDRKGHALLLGEKLSERDPEDRHLRELSAHCRRAAAVLQQADRSSDPQERLRLARSAQAELPDSPQVLRRVVQEELVLMVRRPGGEPSSAFERDYTALRVKAPRLAAALKREVARLVDQQEN